MSDLTDGRIDVIIGGGPDSVSRIVDDMHAMATEIRRFRTCDRTAEFVALRKALHARLDEVQKQAERIRQLESAMAADEERARSVVRMIAMSGVCEAIGKMMGPTYWYDNPGAHATFESVADAIATRAAKQLASAAVRLTAEDARAIQRFFDHVQLWAQWHDHIDGRDAIDRLLATVRP